MAKQNLMQQLENKGDEFLVKKAPFQIPKAGREGIVRWSPWIALVIGVFGLWSGLLLWDAAHTVNQLYNYVNNLAPGYGAGNNLNFFFYLSLAALLASSVLLLVSFPGLKARSKSRGWNLALYGVLLNFLYGLVYLGTDIGGALGRLLLSLISLVIGLYFLFQIRSYYSDKKA